MKTLTDITLNTSPLRECLMQRPRVDLILDKASGCNLVYVIAGAGYGKTAAVQNYINQQEGTVVRWMQLSESDNVGSRYWENFTHSVSLDNPELAKDLQELGFPETLVRFKQFADIIRLKEHHLRKTFLVLDDFDMISSKKALTFVERCANLRIPEFCVIIISRTEPDINTVAMFSKGNATVITEDDLRFTEDEIKDFFEQQEIPCTVGNAERFAESTKGWPLAINLLSLVMKNSQANLDTALKLTTKNINKLFESEAWSTFPGSTQRTLVKLSLVSDLPLPLIHEIIGDAALEKYIPKLASFISYDSFCNNYRIHPLYFSFLQKKQKLLTESEKQGMYREAAAWCLENGFFTSAVKYFAAAREYGKIFEVLRSYPGKLPHDTYKYFLELLQKAESGNEQKENLELSRLKALATPYLLIGMREFGRAEKLTEAVIKRMRQSSAPYETEVLVNAYNALAHISKYTCITTHEYKTAVYLKKSAKISEASGIIAEGQGIFLLPDVRSFACLVGESASQEDFRKFSETQVEISGNFKGLAQKRFYGYDDWKACEIAFFKNKPDEAIHYAHSGVMKARENTQHGIEIMLKQYILRIAIHRGDYSLAKEILKQIYECIGDIDKFERRLLYDLITGSFYIHVGVPEMVATWIFSESEKDESSDIRVPMRELIVTVRYFLECRKYTQALAVLSNSYPRLPHERFLFSELIFSLLFAIAQMKTDDSKSAVENFEKAYRLSYNGVFEMPFVEMGKHITQMTAAVSAEENSIIPIDWLKTIERKATIYAKNTAAIENIFKRENKIEKEVSLSEREREVLSDMCRGLSRDEIAVHRHLSINTVKKILQSLYIKLEANNNLDAVRIAFERKLIE